MERFRTFKSAIIACQKEGAPRQVADYVHFVVNGVLEHHFLPVYSKVAQYIVGQHYAMYLRIMDAIPEIARDHRYLSKASLIAAGDNPEKSRCKAFFLVNPGFKHNSLTCLVTLSFSSLRRFRFVFDKFCVDSVSLELTRSFCSSLVFPSLDSDSLLFSCGPASVVSVSDSLSKSEKEIVCARIAGDGRTYHSLTNLKKFIRGLVHFGSVDSKHALAEIDAHAAHVGFMTHAFAEGDEQRRLVKMLQTGDFYGEFAKEAGFSDFKSVKQSFLVDVLYKFRPNTRLWHAFVRLFPETAGRLAEFRDVEDWVIKRKEKVHEFFGPYRAKTRIGQFYLSRFMCRIEGKIFRAAQNLAYERGMLSAPLHDSLNSLLVWAEACSEIVKQCIFDVLGFELVVKVK